MCHDTTVANGDAVVDQLWRDAYGIAWIGASNPVAVQHTLDKWTETFGADNLAVRAMAGHLAFLRGESLGPEFMELDAVLENARRLGIHND